MSEDLTDADEKIRRLMIREFRDRIDADLRNLEEAANQIEGEEDRREYLELIRRLRELLMGGGNARST